MPQVSITRTTALKNEFLGLKTGGKLKQRMFFDPENANLFNGIGIATKKPFFSCFYQPLQVIAGGRESTVWVDKTSFKKRERKLFDKYVSPPKTENIPYEKQSPEKFPEQVNNLWKAIKKFTPNPPLLKELDRLMKYRSSLQTQGVKIEKGDRGRTLVVSPGGDYFVCLTRSEGQGDFAIREGTRKKVKIAINRATLEERVVATGKKSADPEYAKEIEILEKLRGEEEFVQIDTWAETEDKYYIVMEKCKGNLWNLIADVKEAEKIPMALDYARGLNKLHQRGIIHRDIKPHNLLISANNRGKICDFGEVAEGTSRGGFGTPSFSWDPQMIQNRNPAKDADVWALGAALYLLFNPAHEALPYQKMEDAHASRQALRNLTQKEIDATIDRAGIADRRVSKLLKGMLAIDRAQRLSAEQVVSALEEIQRTPPSQTLFERLYSRVPSITSIWTQSASYVQSLNCLQPLSQLLSRKVRAFYSR